MYFKRKEKQMRETIKFQFETIKDGGKFGEES